MSWPGKLQDCLHCWTSSHCQGALTLNLGLQPLFCAVCRLQVLSVCYQMTCATPELHQCEAVQLLLGTVAMACSFVHGMSLHGNGNGKGTCECV